MVHSCINSNPLKILFVLIQISKNSSFYYKQKSAERLLHDGGERVRFGYDGKTVKRYRKDNGETMPPH
jgi:hypothetical protein